MEALLHGSSQYKRLKELRQANARLLQAFWDAVIDNQILRVLYSNFRDELRNGEIFYILGEIQVIIERLRH